MKEIIVKIRDEDSGLVTQLLEKLGAEVTEKKTVKKKNQVKRKKKKEFLQHIYSENGKIWT